MPSPDFFAEGHGNAVSLPQNNIVGTRHVQSPDFLAEVVGDLGILLKIG